MADGEVSAVWVGASDREVLEVGVEQGDDAGVLLGANALCGVECA